MTGPDSDLWPRTDGPDREWNWQSSESCLVATELGAVGATDEQMLAAVSRYAVENLILNAVHEIGEWFRLDGSRIFPSHPDPTRRDDRRMVDDDIDGNGEVHLELGFPQDWTSSMPAVSGAPEAWASITERVATIVAASRFSYLPGTFVSYGTGGPVVTGADGPGAAWHGAWSSEVVQGAGKAVAADLVDRLVSAVATDVHCALVHYEADRVCRAFHVDGLPVWAVASGRAADRSADDRADPRLQPMTISIAHAGRSARAPR